MDGLVLYIIKINVLLGIFYLLHFVVLRKLSFYNYNRYFWLIAITLSLFLPLTNFTSENIVSASKLNDLSLPQAGNIKTTLQTISPSILSYINWNFIPAGIILSFILFVFKIVNLYLTIRKSQLKDSRNGYQLYTVKTTIPPFSFGNMIIVNEDLIKQDQFKYILAHESVHVIQNHTLDITLAELVKILCWFNPVSWLIAKAIRRNLEFIADAEVLKMGFDSTEYQFCLFQVGVRKAKSPLGLSFNTSDFKLRLFEMNRAKASSSFNFIKYLLIVPVVIVALTLNYSFSSFNKLSEIASRILLQSDTKLDIGKTWKAESDGNSIAVMISNNKVTIEGNEGIAKIKCRNNIDLQKVDLTQFPNAMLLLDGKTYPIKSYQSNPREEIHQIIFLIGKPALKEFGEQGKNGIIIASK